MESAVSVNVRLDILVHHAKIRHVILTINVSMVEHVLFKDPDSRVIVLMDSQVNSVKSHHVTSQCETLLI
jgi:hypothetical protein